MLRARIRALEPQHLIVADMGSRPGTILDGVPTLVIDHHDTSRGVPENAIVLNSCGREPVAPSSVLAFLVCRGTPEVDQLVLIDMRLPERSTRLYRQRVRPSLSSCQDDRLRSSFGRDAMIRCGDRRFLMEAQCRDDSRSRTDV